MTTLSQQDGLLFTLKRTINKDALRMLLVVDAHQPRKTQSGILFIVHNENIQCLTVCLFSISYRMALNVHFTLIRNEKKKQLFSFHMRQFDLQIKCIYIFPIHMQYN